MAVTQDITLRLALVRVMRLTICPMCAERKLSGQCFCKSCYFALPRSLRNLLYTPLDEADGEFEEHYLKAMRYLHSRGCHRPYKSWAIEAQDMIAETGLLQALAREKANRRRELGI